jgi:ABC-2 type transport system permease protein
MRSVLEEKNSRVVEIVLSSMKPFQLMMGKILGIAAVGFTQYAIWAVFGLAATRYSRKIVSGMVPADTGFKIPSVPGYIFIYFVVFFILGYFLYATFYAAIGAMVNSEKEAQQLLMPVSMFLIIPILLMTLVLKSPDSSISVVLSIIPFFAPILMLLRICLLLPSAVQIGGAVVLLILSTVVMIWVAAKIYRVGILMYGKRPNFKEIIKWMRYS